MPGLGPKAFEQAAGFLRIRGGDNPLDASAIHPESYPVAEAVLKKAGLTAAHSRRRRTQSGAGRAAGQQPAVEKLAAELGAGVPTLTDILEQLVRPGRDPRQDTPAPILRTDVLSMEDLAAGHAPEGHRAQRGRFWRLCRYRRQAGWPAAPQPDSAGDRLQVGDMIEVEIQKVEKERGRIAPGLAQGVTPEMESPSEPPPTVHVINLSAFIRTLITPLVIWGGLVGMAVLANQPGIVCITPVAWLLALWSGVHYINMSEGVPDRYPLLGPAIVGALLGLGQGILFLLVSSWAMPVTTPDDQAKAALLTAVIFVGGILACAALSAFTAWLRLHRKR